MARTDTVNKYIEAFLAGKSEKAREQFLAKDIDRQYQSIMTWRYNMRKRGMDVDTAVRSDDVVESLRRLRKGMEKRTDFTARALADISEELSMLSQFVKEATRRQQLSEIEQLERQRNEIAGRLEELRRRMDDEAPSEH